MQILTLPPVTAQLVRAGEVPLDHHFELSGHNQSEDKILARSSIREVTRHGGRLWRKVRPYPFVRRRGSSIASTPRSVVLRIKRPSPCFNAMIACGTLYW